MIGKSIYLFLCVRQCFLSESSLKFHVRHKAMATTQMVTSQAADFLIHGYIRENSIDRSIPLDVKNLITTFVATIFASKILTVKEQINFIDLLSQDRIKNIYCRTFKLLYRGSENDFRCKKFHKLCDDYFPTFIIILTEFGNVFGGYTEVSWRANTNYTKQEYTEDENSFLFLIRSNDEEIQKSAVPKIFKCLNASKATYQSSKNGPIFGDGPDLCIIDKCDKEYIFKYDEEHIEQMSYIYDDKENGINTFDYHGNILCGGNAGPKKNDQTMFFRVIEYEVFQLQ